GSRVGGNRPRGVGTRRQTPKTITDRDGGWMRSWPRESLSLSIAEQPAVQTPESPEPRATRRRLRGSDLSQPDVRSSHLGLTWADAAGLGAVSTGLAGRVHSVMCCLSVSAAAVGASGAFVGDSEGEFLEFGDQFAEPAVVVEPVLVVGDEVVGDETCDRLAVDLAGPLPVGAVQDRWVGVAVAAGPAAAGVPLDEGPGER